VGDIVAMQTDSNLKKSLQIVKEFF